METEPRLEDVFTQLKDLHNDHEVSRETPVWYGYKLEEEVLEYQVEANNDPNTLEWEKAVSELDDIGITLIGAYIANGIGADTAILRMGAKLLEVRRRFESGHYDDKPRLKLRGGNKPIAMSEGVDYMSDYE